MDASDILNEVSRQVEELAMQIALDGGDRLEDDLADHVESQTLLVKEIQRKAFEGALTEIETAVTGLVVALAAGPEPDAAARLLRDGIEPLQDAVARSQSTVPVSETQALAQDPELVTDFVQEAREHLGSIETQVLELERDPDHSEAIHAAFRAFHTIKGLAGFLEFGAIQEVAHEVESLLDLARNGTLAIDTRVIDVVLEGGDYLGQAVTLVERQLTEPGPLTFSNATALLERIRAVAVQNGTTAAKQPPEDLGPTLAAEAGGGAGNEETASPAVAQAEAPSPDTAAGEVPEKMGAGPDPAVRPFASEPAANSLAPSAPGVAAPAAPPVPAVEPKPAAAPRENLSVRVDITKLDHLVDMVGELVIAQAMVRQDPSLASVSGTRMQRSLTQLSRITSEVQKTTMSMRMVEVGLLFKRVNRMVRDLSRKSGKKVTLEMSGEETELDKTIIEELADPLLHMVRNAIDHGLEPPDQRTEVGKEQTGHISLAAYHQAGHIVIDIADDGRGLNREKILAKAVSRGLVDPEAQLPDAEVFNLIFEAGFSTADKVSDISGRGVGMDVVRKRIQKLRGRVEIESRPGQGTTFHLRLPLTLAIIEGLVVGVGGDRYILPISTVKEMLRPTPEMISSLEGRHEMAMVRENLLPIVRLHERFQVAPRAEDPCQGLLIVVEGEGHRFCLLVDEFIGKQEVVIKSLGESLKDIAGVAGGAILGDGRVGLILDMNGVFEVPAYA